MMLNNLILEGDFISYEVKEDVGFITIENENRFLIAVKGMIKDNFETKKDKVLRVRVGGRLKPNLIVAEHIDLKLK